MTSKISTTEDFRIALELQHLTSFLNQLQNDDEPNSERSKLIALIDLALTRLYTIERKFAEDAYEANKCLACFSNNVQDASNVDSVLTLFEHYIQVSDQNEESH